MRIYGLKESLGVAGLGVGLGVLGDKLGSTGLQQGGQVAVNFVPAMVNVGMAGTTINMLKGFKRI